MAIGVDKTLRDAIQGHATTDWPRAKVWMKTERGVARGVRGGDFQVSQAMGFIFGAIWLAWILFMLFGGFGDLAKTYRGDSPLT